MAGFFEEGRDNNGRERERGTKRNVCRVRDKREAQGKQKKKKNRAVSCSENLEERATVTTKERKDETYEEK